MLNLALGRTYLSAQDPALMQRTWQMAIEKYCSIGKDSTRTRKERELTRKTYDLLKRKNIIETTADDFFKVLEAGTASTQHYLRCLHSLAQGLGWLPWDIIPAKLWPALHPASKRAITWEEHQRIVQAEKNRERQLFYELLWEIGAAQSDAASLDATHIDWENRTFSFQRRKTGAWCHLRIGKRLDGFLQQLPRSGSLFPHISGLSANDRSAEFYRRCKLLKIKGISLHSYRYSWAERAKTCGYPERFAQENLGHNSKAVHRAYAKKAKVELPALEEYESQRAQEKVIRLLACGPPFAETLTPLQNALLCYVVPKDGCNQMSACLTTLSSELQAAALTPGPHSVHGLEVAAQDLVYSWDNAFKQHTGISSDSIAVLHDLKADTDPSPLLLIYSDQDCPNPQRSGYYRRVLTNQVVAKLVSDLNLLPIEQAYTITARELLRQTTDGVLNYLALDRQRNMIRTVRQNIFRRIASFWGDKSFTPVRLEGEHLQINFKDNLAKAELMDWLEDPKRTSFVDQSSPTDQPLLPGIEPPQEETN